MTIKEFIETAIEGGYKTTAQHKWVLPDGYVTALDSIFLDPKAWEAVAKVKGWKQPFKTRIWFWKSYGTLGEFCSPDIYVNKMHDMIDALTEGMTLEEYIATL